MSAEAIEKLLGVRKDAAAGGEAARPGIMQTEQQDAHADLLAEASEPDAYRPYITRPRPQMGFTLVEAGGTMHGFMYHTLRHPKHQHRDGTEFLSFTADGLAVVMQGKGLNILFRALIRHTLAEAREYDERPIVDETTRIDRLGVMDTQPQLSRDPPARLVK